MARSKPSLAPSQYSSKAPAYAPSVLVMKTSARTMLPCLVRKPASGRMTSLGMGGMTVSAKVKSPTPHSPNESMLRAAKPAIPVSSSTAFADIMAGPWRRDGT